MLLNENLYFTSAYNNVNKKNKWRWHVIILHINCYTEKYIKAMLIGK